MGSASALVMAAVLYIGVGTRMYNLLRCFPLLIDARVLQCIVLISSVPKFRAHEPVTSERLLSNTTRTFKPLRPGLTFSQFFTSSSFGGIRLLLALSAFTTWPWILPTRYCGSRIPTMLNSRHAVSLGCAPTPTQYRAREISSAISFHGRPCVSPGRGGWGLGSYVPSTSRGRELRAVLWVVD